MTSVMYRSATIVASGSPADVDSTWHRESGCKNGAGTLPVGTPGCRCERVSEFLDLLRVPRATWSTYRGSRRGDRVPARRIDVHKKEAATCNTATSSGRTDASPPSSTGIAVRVRPYAEEVARTATIQFSHADGLDLRRVAALVTGYRTIVPLGGDDLADGVHRLWWKECRTAGSSWKRSSDVRRA